MRGRIAAAAEDLAQRLGARRGLRRSLDVLDPQRLPAARSGHLRRRLARRGGRLAPGDRRRPPSPAHLERRGQHLDATVGGGSHVERGQSGEPWRQRLGPRSRLDRQPGIGDRTEQGRSRWRRAWTTAPAPPASAWQRAARGRRRDRGRRPAGRGRAPPRGRRRAAPGAGRAATRQRAPRARRRAVAANDRRRRAAGSPRGSPARRGLSGAATPGRQRAPRAAWCWRRAARPRPAPAWWAARYDVPRSCHADHGAGRATTALFRPRAITSLRAHVDLESPHESTTPASG